MPSFSGDKFGEVTSDLHVALRWVHDNRLGDKVRQAFVHAYGQLSLPALMSASDDVLMKHAQDWQLGALATRRFLNAVACLRQQYIYEPTLTKLPQGCAEKRAVTKPQKKNHQNVAMASDVEQAHDNGVKNVLSARPSGTVNDVTRNEANSYNMDGDVSMSSVTPSLHGSMTVSAMSNGSSSNNNSNHGSILRGPQLAVINDLQEDDGKKKPKTRYCRDFFSAKGCRRGEKCKYAHSVFERTSVPRKRRGQGRKRQW